MNPALDPIAMTKKTIFASKLPYTANSIFSEMSALAQKHQAVNLSQGFPDYDIDPALADLVDQAIRDGHNQYAPMPGLLSLRERITEKYHSFYRLDVDPQHEVTITAGATQALFTAIATLVHPGDEVIIFEPAYDQYRPSVEVFGGKVIPVCLYAPSFTIDWEEVKSKLTPKTKLIIVNNPGNPSGAIWSKGDMDELAKLVTNTNIYLLSDEVYEHLIYDEEDHYPMLQHPILRGRSFVVASFGKLLHSTGWKIGYIIAPSKLTDEFRKIHQFNVFSVNTPMQDAIAHYLNNPTYYSDLACFFEKKRDFVLEGLADSKFRVHVSKGTYFLLLNYGALSEKNELDYAVELTQQHGVALIPISAFYGGDVQQKTLRLCFAKKEETLSHAIQIINSME